MKKIVLSLLILLSLSNTLTQASLLDKNNIPFSTLKTTAYHATFLAPTALNVYRYLNAENILNNKFTKIEDENITSFIQDACSKITDQKINFYIGNASTFGLSAGYFAAAIGDNNIIIEPSYYEIIKEYISDKTKENRDIVLNILNFLMQHEAGHLKNKDSRNRVIRSIVSYITKACLFEISKKTIDFKASQLITFLSLNNIDTVIQSYLNKQQEYKADAGILGQNTINGGKQFFSNLINLGKSNDEIYWAMKFDLNHPSCEKRLKNLQKLEQTETA